MDWNALLHNSFLIKLAIAIVEILIGFALGPVVRNMILKLHRKGVNQGVLTFSSSVANILIRTVAILIAMAQIGVNISVLVGAFSAVGLGISLALKENMANVASGMQILITKPFVVDNYIACNDQEGTVTAIDIMFTTLKTFNNQEIIIPNSQLVCSSIINYSRYPARRIVVKVPLAADTDCTPFRSTMKEWMDAQPKVLQDPAPSTSVSGFTDSGNGVYVNLLCYTNLDDYWDQMFALTQKAQETRTAMKLCPPVDLVSMVKQ